MDTRGPRPRICFVPHVGDSLGHLIRALAVADELTSLDCEVEIVAWERVAPLIRAWSAAPPRHHPIRWDWSHNGAPMSEPTDSFARRVCQSAADVRRILDASSPDLVVGFPGVFTTQVARSLGLPHVSVLHAPYLWPLIELDSPTWAEAAVRRLAETGMDRVANPVMEALARELGVPPLDYPGFLRTEQMLVAQDGVPLQSHDNIRRIGFIRASYGDPHPPIPLDPERVGLVCFGTGNPCDLLGVARAVRRVFPQVLVTGWRGPRGEVEPGIFASGPVSNAALAGRVGALVTHGGVGTVGAFIEHGTPQVLVPTEIDQATMAVLVARNGFATTYGLEEWAREPALGRRLPNIDVEQLASRLRAALAAPSSPRAPSDGAVLAATELRRLARGAEPDLPLASQAA